MIKYIKYTFLFVIVFLLAFMISCKDRNKHDCQAGDWIYPESYECEKDFTIVKKCNTCDRVLEEKIVNIPHEINIETIDATCSIQGTITEKCKNCDYSIVKYTDKLEHSIEKTILEPTCIMDGYIEEKCINCDYYTKEILTDGKHDLKITDIPPKCNVQGLYEERCQLCDYVYKETFPGLRHEYEVEDLEPTCTSEGYHKETCSICGHTWQNKIKPTGHSNFVYIVDREATDELYGIKHKECNDCHESFEIVQFANNGFSNHGKLSVEGTDLVDKNGEKFQLIGISTHGLQWAGQYVRFDTFEALRNTFGINVIRLSLYTSEDGYCDGTAAKKEKLYQRVVDGIKYATELDMYVILDWHMLGPNLFEEEAIEFFTRITEEYPNNENILFEIMNEPYSNELKTITWADCKKYAEKIIPIIREHNDGVVLIGSPRYTTDLESIQANPIIGIDNIMYSYHFYAADHQSTTALINAYDAGLPIFITEHGGMEATGDGEINHTSILNWYKVLDSRNISYVAWNLSNTRGSASILQYNNPTYTVFNMSTMKAWGIFYRARVRIRFGLPGLTD